MKHPFGEGDNVVCINNGDIPGCYNTDLHLLRLREVYVIEQIITYSLENIAPDGDDIGIKLVGIYPNHPYWSPRRFRPVSHCLPGRSILHSLLTKPPSKELVDDHNRQHKEEYV